MRKLLFILFLLPIIGFTQAFTYRKNEESYPESFSDFLEGVAYAHIFLVKK